MRVLDPSDVGSGYRQMLHNRRSARFLPLFRHLPDEGAETTLLPPKYIGDGRSSVRFSIYSCRRWRTGIL